MMSIHEIKQLSMSAEVAASAIDEDEVDVCLSGHSEDEEQFQEEENMNSLDLTDVFGVPSTSKSNGSGECNRSGDSSSSSSSYEYSSFDTIHKDSRELIRRKMNKKDGEAHTTKRLPFPFSYAIDQRMSSDTASQLEHRSVVDDDDDDDEDDDLHNDSRKLIKLNTKRRATWSNATAQVSSDDEDSDNDLSLKALHNDSLGLLKNLVSRANNGGGGSGIFHRSMSDSNLTTGLHNDSLNMLLGKKATTTTNEDSKTMMEAFVDQLVGDRNGSDSGNHASNNGSSSSILDALHSRDSLRELAGVHLAPRSIPLRD